MRWWDIADAWRARAAGARHGDLDLLAASFASEQGIAPGSVRRAARAREFCERLMAARTGLAREVLEAVPLETLLALRRIVGFDAAAVDLHLDGILSRGLEGAALARIEADARLRAGRDTGTKATNAHVIRTRAAAFRESALAALSDEARAAGLRLMAVSGRGPLPLVAIDAVVRRGPVSFCGVRLLAETSRVGNLERAKDTASFAIAGARYLDAVDIVARRMEDADAIAALVLAEGPCGVGVRAHTPGEPLRTLVVPRRDGPPDLAMGGLDRVAGWAARAFAEDGDERGA